MTAHEEEAFMWELEINGEKGLEVTSFVRYFITKYTFEMFWGEKSTV